MAEPKRAAMVKDVPADEFVAAYAAHLKSRGKLEIPKWLDLVKDGPLRQLGPKDPDWFYIRAASCARQIYIKPGVGAGQLRKRYGGAWNRGTKPWRRAPSSGSVMRAILQGLEKINVLQAGQQGKGRCLTRLGQQDLDSIAAQVIHKIPVM